MKCCKKCGDETVLQNGLCGTCIGIEAHFKKVNEEWVKYHRCPECKEAFEIKEEK